MAASTICRSMHSIAFGMVFLQSSLAQSDEAPRPWRRKRVLRAILDLQCQLKLEAVFCSLSLSATMDVKKGHCWRCEESIVGRSDICSQCEKATYCSVKCRQDDQYRHKPECEVWGAKKCNNLQCSVSGKLKECTGCNDAWYCGVSCQQEDRSNHKKLCRERARSVTTAAEQLRARLRKPSDILLRTPYYIGNALAVDMLNLQENECSKNLGQEEREKAEKRDYKVLTAGCGNLRNVIHTVAFLPHEVLGNIHVTLNDFDPFVQARNVLFLYMMVVFAPKNDIATMLTTLWYSLHLSSRDYHFVMDCLKTLTQLTGSALAGATKGLVKVHEEYMPQLREVWRGWLELQCLRSDPKSINLRKQRQEMFARDSKASNGIEFLKRQMPRQYLKSFEEWLENGAFFSSLTDNLANLEYDNPTMTGYNLEIQLYNLSGVRKLMRSPRLKKFVYCVRSDLQPFGEWDQLLVQKHTSSNSLVDLYHTYIANQIQLAVQFLKNKRLFTTVHVCHCLELCSRLKLYDQFDRIFTSNIADYVGTKNLLRALKGLLETDNKYATIVTQYWNWYDVFPSVWLDGDPKRVEEGTMMTCMIAALNDTDEQRFEGKPDPQMLMQFLSTMEKGIVVLQEYFNYIVYFINFMRSELMACNESLPADKAVSFKEVLKTEGLQMIDFRHELNRVVPFAYRRNIRPLNLLRGMERMVEWRLPE